MPVSYLCCEGDEVGKVVKKMDHDNVEKVRMISSFRRYSSIAPWVKVIRINPEFRVLRLTFHRKSASKC